MSQIVSPFMKEVIHLLEARDVVVCTYTSRLDRLVIDSPEIDDRARWGSETRSFGLPLGVLEGRVVATFRNVVEAAIGIGASREILARRGDGGHMGSRSRPLALSRPVG